MPRMQGGSEVTLSAQASLTSVTNKQAWARPPIDVDFQVLMFTASGLIVRFLKVFEKSNYNSVKWVRYLTKASGSYQVRVSTNLASFALSCNCWTQLSSSPTRVIFILHAFGLVFFIHVLFILRRYKQDVKLIDNKCTMRPWIHKEKKSKAKEFQWEI